MKNILFKLVLSYLILGSFDCLAQVYKGVNAGAGKTIIRSKTTNSDVQGSFYLFDDWMPGKVYFADSTMTEAKEMKFDVGENLVVTKGEDDVENTFIQPVTQFSIVANGKTLEFRKGFTGKNLKEDTFIQQIYSSSKIGFYKKEEKTVLESKGYNTAAENKIETTFTYYLQLDPNNKQLTLVKRDNKSILSALGDKPQLLTYFKDNKLNLKKDEDIVTLLKYYDTL